MHVLNLVRNPARRFPDRSRVLVDERSVEMGLVPDLGAELDERLAAYRSRVGTRGSSR